MLYGCSAALGTRGMPDGNCCKFGTTLHLAIWLMSFANTWMVARRPPLAFAQSCPICPTWLAARPCGPPSPLAFAQCPLFIPMSHVLAPLRLAVGVTYHILPPISHLFSCPLCTHTLGWMYLYTLACPRPSTCMQTWCLRAATAHDCTIC